MKKKIKERVVLKVNIFFLYVYSDICNMYMCVQKKVTF